MSIVGGNPSTKAKRIEGVANAFALWRVAVSVDWDCTIKEAAQEVGITPSAAQRIAGERGWTDRFNPSARSQARGTHNQQAPDTLQMMGVGR
ncbi:MAG: hypothetical protein KJP02_05400 [Octadecabacter sp.]|nr:hypothetical protein [Octadecabacter sp.]